MAELQDRQWELDGRLLMGRRTKFIVGDPDFDAAEVIGDPVAAPRADGQRWGRGYRGGRTITLDITVNCHTPAEGRLAAAELEAAWDAADIRSTPGGLSVLRWQYAGETRRVYGRTGQLATATTTFDRAGRIDYTAEFTTVDHLFYGDTVEQTVVPFVPAELGGLVGSQVGGWSATTAGTASGVVDVNGSSPSWLTWTIRGPIVNPTIEVTGLWSATLNMSLAYDQSVTVDPTPWNRSVRRNDGASFAGAFTSTSERLSRMRVPPGVVQVLLKGVDPSGTSSLTAQVRPVHATY